MGMEVKIMEFKKQRCCDLVIDFNRINLDRLWDLNLVTIPIK